MIFRSVKDWIDFKRSHSVSNLGFVPTMGALHKGHLSLVKTSQKENPKTLVSVFVNPTQFNNPDDLTNYPRDEKADLDLLQETKVDFILLPQASEIYHDNYRFRVQENNLSQILCGAFRPGHFDGVLTVVLKLLNIIEPANSYFGQKDYQQYLLIKDMAKSLFIKSNIIGLPTIREADGLAMSSRNRLLSEAERQKAIRFPELLRSNKQLHEIRKDLENEGFKVDYIEEHFQRRFGAVYLGSVRLIDNVQV